MKPKIISSLGLIVLMAASCNLGGSATPAGIIKTGNGGADWQTANIVKDQKNGTLAGRSISEIIFEPGKPDRMYAGSVNDGVFISEDGANSWRQILSRINVYGLVVQDSNTIFAAGFFADHGRVLLTQDGGKSWVEIFNEASAQNPVRAIAQNPTNHNELVLGLASGTLIKSADAGKTWRLLQNYNDRINRIRWTNSGLYVVVRNTGVFKSNNSGESFISLTASLSSSNGYYGVLISPSGIATFNQVAVSPANPNTIYMSTSSGLYRTTDEGQTWAFMPLPAKQRDLPAVAVAIAPSGDNAVYTSIGSTIYKTSDGGGSWQAKDSQTDHTVNILAVHPQLSQIAFAGLFIQ